jgi:hypothetical protein
MLYNYLIISFYLSYPLPVLNVNKIIFRKKKMMVKKKCEGGDKPPLCHQFTFDAHKSETI